MTAIDRLLKKIEDYFDNTSTDQFVKEWDSFTDSHLDPVPSPLAKEYLAYLENYPGVAQPQTPIPNTWTYSNSQPLTQGVVFFCSIV